MNKQPKKKAPEERPEWVLDTPMYNYLLYAESNVSDDGAGEQKIDVTLEEFESLKKHLAKMRGFKVNTVVNGEVVNA